MAEKYTEIHVLVIIDRAVLQNGYCTDAKLSTVTDKIKQLHEHQYSKEENCDENVSHDRSGKYIKKSSNRHSAVISSSEHGNHKIVDTERKRNTHIKDLQCKQNIRKNIDSKVEQRKSKQCSDHTRKGWKKDIVKDRKDGNDCSVHQSSKPQKQQSRKAENDCSIRQSSKSQKQQSRREKETTERRKSFYFDVTLSTCVDTALNTCYAEARLSSCSETLALYSSFKYETCDHRVSVPFKSILQSKTFHKQKETPKRGKLYPPLCNSETPLTANMVTKMKNIFKNVLDNNKNKSIDSSNIVLKYDLKKIKSEPVDDYEFTKVAIKSETIDTGYQGNVVKHEKLNMRCIKCEPCGTFGGYGHRRKINEPNFKQEPTVRKTDIEYWNKEFVKCETKPFIRDYVGNTRSCIDVNNEEQFQDNIDEVDSCENDFIVIDEWYHK